MEHKHRGHRRLWTLHPFWSSWSDLGTSATEWVREEKSGRICGTSPLRTQQRKQVHVPVFLSLLSHSQTVNQSNKDKTVATRVLILQVRRSDGAWELHGNHSAVFLIIVSARAAFRALQFFPRNVESFTSPPQENHGQKNQNPANRDTSRCHKLMAKRVARHAFLLVYSAGLRETIRSKTERTWLSASALSKIPTEALKFMTRQILRCLLFSQYTGASEGTRMCCAMALASEWRRGTGSDCNPLERANLKI